MTVTNANYDLKLTTPARRAEVVVPSSNKLSFPALLTVVRGTGGTVHYETIHGDDVTETLPQHGEIPVQIVKIFADSTATNITIYG